jgi:hypothetical protein
MATPSAHTAFLISSRDYCIDMDKKMTSTVAYLHHVKKWSVCQCIQIQRYLTKFPVPHLDAFILEDLESI